MSPEILDAILPVLEAIAQAAQHIPVPWVMTAGAILAAAVVVARKLRGKAPAARAPLAEVVRLPVAHNTDTTPKTEATVAEIAKKTLGED